MLAFTPIKISGRWQDGYALDLQTLNSVYVGDDQYGHARFTTHRPPVGDLLYRLKNSGDTSAVAELAETAATFVKAWAPPVSAIVPVAPSNPNRVVQPVSLVGKALAETLGLNWMPDVVKKVKATGQLKDVSDLDERLAILAGAFSGVHDGLMGVTVLLFDDLYRSGATMNSISDVLYDECKADVVYALTLTRTRVNR